MLRLIKQYVRFHGKKPKEIYKKKFHDPGALICIGDAHKIEYISDKFNGGGDGKKAIYEHKFKRGTKLYMDERGCKQLYIMGPYLKVNERGIIN